MLLQYAETKGQFVLRVPRHNGSEIQTLMKDHGLDFSVTASTPREGVLFTPEPYAAVAFAKHATPEALEQLSPIMKAIDESWLNSSGAHIKCPSDVEPWPFQKAGIEYALRRKHTLIADQPGLGKTVQAICIANEMGAKNVLVICPAAIRLQWVLKIREWSTMPWPFITHPIMSSRNGVHPNANWTVVSYDLAAANSMAPQLAQRYYDLVILDEAHYLKEPSSRRTRSIFGGGKDRVALPLAERSEHIVALTGTPLPNRPREAFTLCRGLCWDAIDWMHEAEFERRFNPRHTVRAKSGSVFAVDERIGRHHELQARLRGNFMVRREKHGALGVMDQLQMPVYDIIQLETTGPVKQALAAESLLAIDPEDLSGADAEILGHIAAVRRMMGIALAPQIADYVDMLLDGGEEKLVVFAWHTEVLDIMQERLTKHGVLRIDGSTSGKKRQQNVQDFQDKPEHKVIIGNMLAMGVGVDGLQHVANHCLGRETVVLTNHGNKTIVDVTTDDLVWDGKSWVKHQGLVFQGVRETVDLAGIRITADHRVLVRNTMTPASTILRDNALPQALETALASLPSGGIREGLWAASSASSSNAIADGHHTMSERIRCILEWLRNAVRALQAERRTGSVGARLAQMMICDACFFGDTQRWSNAVTIPEPLNINTMAAVELRFAENGERTALVSWPTSSVCQGMTTRDISLIESTPTGATSQATYGSAQSRPITTTEGLSPSCRQNLRLSEPVFDLVNAGPSHRFTVLTPDGRPLIVSNCLIAEPDWVPGNNVQAIDRLDRGGQKRQVQADLFVAPGSIAERVLASALRKMRTIHKALDAKL